MSEEGRGKNRKQGILQQCSKVQKHYFHHTCFVKYLTVPQYTHIFFLTCPERGCLPVMVVMGEAGEAWHAAGVVVLEPLKEFT